MPRGAIAKNQAVLKSIVNATKLAWRAESTANAPSARTANKGRTAKTEIGIARWNWRIIENNGLIYK